MRSFQPLIALLCVFLTFTPFSIAQEAQTRVPTIELPNGGFLGTLRKYQAPTIPPIDLSNTSRLDALLRAGKIYLSLQDAVALTLENNLDIARQRYGTLLAETDLQRAKAGGALRGVNTNVNSGPTGAGGTLSLNAFSSGSGGTGASSGSGVNGIISQLGPTIPNLDPLFTSTISWGHQTSPQTSPFLYGTSALVATQRIYDYSISQGFLTGGQAQLSFNNSNTNLNSGRNDINPNLSSNLQLFVTQPLLQGFGFAVNNRNIRVAKNNIKVSDLVFKQQVITTVSSIVGLYWDLVSFNENVRVARQSLAVSQKLYEDNKKQVEIGTLAPIEIIRAEAEVASRQQDLTVAETNVLQQETVIKNALSRNGVASPSIAEARIVPTDHITIPETEPVEPIQDLVAKAYQDRPELGESYLNLDNSKISLVGSKNALRPSLNAFVSLNNNAQAGPINTNAPLDANGNPIVGGARNPVDPFFIGGYGTILGQIFGRNFPDYRVGVQLSIPLRNRAAQADYARDMLTLRQSEIDLQKQVNQIRVDVQNSLIALQQSRARYQAAVKQRILQEQTLDAEQKKYALGASTIYTVIQTQRDLATAQSTEVTAQSQYIRARVNLDVATGQILPVYSINIDEAVKGVVARPPSPLPVIDRP